MGYQTRRNRRETDSRKLIHYFSHFLRYFVTCNLSRAIVNYYRKSTFILDKIILTDKYINGLAVHLQARSQ